MKIESVRIQNLRSMKDETICLGDYTCLVGPNGAGKSNVICALNIFFRETADCATDLTTLDEEDFHQKQTDEPVTITLTFTDLNQEAQEDLSHYCRQGKLIVSAVATFDAATGKAAVLQYGQRMGLEAFRKFFDAQKAEAKVAALKEIYEDLREGYPQLPKAGTEKQMQEALWDYESAHAAGCVPIPSQDRFYGQPGRGENLLEKHVQWVYIPAVKDAASEETEAKNTALGRLLERTVRAKVDFTTQIDEFRKEWRAEYQEFLDGHQSALNELSTSLAARVAAWSHPDASVKLEWAEDPEKSVRVAEPIAGVLAGEGTFQGRLPRFGHGLQRCYLFALLQELAYCGDAKESTLVLACEEPELYQHPPQARHLSNVLQHLSESNSQVLISTHSPYFVSGERFEDVRMIRKRDGRSAVSYATYDEIGKDIAKARGDDHPKPSGTLAKVHQALQSALGEMFFTPRLVLVEGLEDLAYVTTYLNLMDLWDEYRRFGIHIVPTDGKSQMVRPLAIAARLGIPAYCVFDADRDKPDKNGSRKKHERDNTAILTMAGVANPEPFPDTTYWGKRVVMWPSEFAKVVASEIGQADWEACCAQADRDYDCAGGLGKNTLHIARVLALAWDAGKRSQSLEKLCNALVDFGEQG